jgi:hypothetical protein
LEPIGVYLEETAGIQEFSFQEDPRQCLVSVKEIDERMWEHVDGISSTTLENEKLEAAKLIHAHNEYHKAVSERIEKMGTREHVKNQLDAFTKEEQEMRLANEQGILEAFVQHVYGLADMAAVYLPTENCGTATQSMEVTISDYYVTVGSNPEDDSKKHILPHLWVYPNDPPPTIQASDPPDFLQSSHASDISRQISDMVIHRMKMLTVLRFLLRTARDWQHRVICRMPLDQPDKFVQPWPDKARDAEIMHALDWALHDLDNAVAQAEWRLELVDSARKQVLAERQAVAEGKNQWPEETAAEAEQSM